MADRWSFRVKVLFALTFAAAMAATLWVGPGSALAQKAPVTTEEDDSPAAEAPPAVRDDPRPAPKPRPVKAAAAPDGSMKALAARVEKQGKDLAQLKQENARLREQVRLLFSIVNKLAGLSQGK